MRYLKLTWGVLLAFFGKDEPPITDWEQKGSRHPTWQKALEAGDL